MCKPHPTDPRYWSNPPDMTDYPPRGGMQNFQAVTAPLVALGVLMACTNGDEDDGGGRPGPLARARAYMNQPIDDARAPRNGPRPAPPFHWAIPAARGLLMCTGGDESDDVSGTPPRPGWPSRNEADQTAPPGGWGKFRIRPKGTHGPWNFRRLLDLALHRHPAYNRRA